MPTTLLAYGKILEEFVAMLLREQGDYKTIYPVELKNRITALKTKLEAEISQDIQDSIHAILFFIWSRSWSITADNPLPDPTERFIMLKSLKEDKSHSQPAQMTGLLAKLKYNLRLVMLKEIKSQNTQRDADLDLTTCQALENWIHEHKTHSTFNRLCSLQHLASALAFGEAKLSNIWWTEGENWSKMRYKGEELCLANVQSMFVAMEERTTKLWETDILLGLNLRAEYTIIKEDLSIHDVGYSFLSDPRNPFLDCRNKLGTAVLGNPTLKQRFTYVANGRIEWKMAAVATWLAKYAELNQLHLLRCEMLNGGPSRGTELTAMIYCTTPTRPIRNLSILGSYLVMLSTYSKTQAISGKDRLIPHAIDGYLSDLLIQDLALARPFAEYLLQVCFPKEKNTLHLYRYYLFVNGHGLFKTEHLSAVMREYTIDNLHTPLTVRDWRHVAIAWRRVLCPTDQALFDNNLDEDHIGAEQTGHTVATERINYAVSPETLVGLPEDVFPLFLVERSIWQKSMKVVPGKHIRILVVVRYLRREV